MICKLPRENRLSVTQEEEEHDEESAGRNTAEICSTYEQTDCGSDCPQIFRQRPITPGKLQSWLWKNNLLAHLFQRLDTAPSGRQTLPKLLLVAGFSGRWAKLINVTRGVCLMCTVHKTLAKTFQQKMNCNSNGVNKSQSNFFSPAWLVQLFCQLDSNNNKNCGKKWTQLSF